MANIFDTPEMAAGYARSRPAVHPLVLELTRKHLGSRLPVSRALDVGCGAGLSTRALQKLALHCEGIDPSEMMIKAAIANVPDATFQVGGAEALPVPSSSVDIIAAAGSLNYADLDRFFSETMRALAPDGLILVYDFSQGKSFRNSGALDDWFTRFLARYPMPSDPAREINPEMLASWNSGFRMKWQERFELGLKMSPAAYVDYIMTEVNVSHAMVQGVSDSQISSWCAESLKPVFRGEPREVLFRGYIACLTR